MKDMMFIMNTEKVIDMFDKASCPKCEDYKKEYEKYKRKYELAKSGLTKEERYALIELICNEQLMHIIPNNKHETQRYNMLEELKAKIRTV